MGRGRERYYLIIIMLQEQITNKGENSRKGSAEMEADYVTSHSNTSKTSLLTKMLTNSRISCRNPDQSSQHQQIKQHGSVRDSAFLDEEQNLKPRKKNTLIQPQLMAFDWKMKGETTVWGNQVRNKQKKASKDIPACSQKCDIY